MKRKIAYILLTVISLGALVLGVLSLCKQPQTSGIMETGIGGYGVVWGAVRLLKWSGRGSKSDTKGK